MFATLDLLLGLGVLATSALPPNMFWFGACRPASRCSYLFAGAGGLPTLRA